ncbi:MAG: ABC transporter ATP-binding protein [bacterium]|jgi:energy-coupling factor transport system ATP-binding protein
MTPALEVENLSFRYRAGGRKILTDISFSLTPGEMLGVCGPSGCGKSTLCLTLCGIIPHSVAGEMTGDVRIFGESTRLMNPARIARRVGIVFQDPEAQLFLPRLRNELAFAPENLCRPRAEIRETVTAIAEMLAIDSLLAANPNELSGGQQQVAVIGSVLTQDPAVLVLDEVLAMLDETNGQNILAIIDRLRRQGKTIIMVDHRQEHLSGADRLLVLEEGRIKSLDRNGAAAPKDAGPDSAAGAG